MDQSIKPYEKVIFGLATSAALFLVFMIWLLLGSHEANNLKESSPLRQVDSATDQNDDIRLKILSLLPVRSSRSQVDFFIRSNFCDSSPTGYWEYQKFRKPEDPDRYIALRSSWTLWYRDAAVVLFLFDARSQLRDVVIKEDAAAL